MSQKSSHHLAFALLAFLLIGLAVVAVPFARAGDVLGQPVSSLRLPLRPFNVDQVHAKFPDYRFGGGVVEVGVYEQGIAVGVAVREAMPNTKYKIVLEYNYGREGAQSEPIGFLMTGELGNGDGHASKLLPQGQYHIGFTLADYGHFKDEHGNVIPFKVLSSEPLDNVVTIGPAQTPPPQSPPPQSPQPAPQQPSPQTTTLLELHFAPYNGEAILAKKPDYRFGAGVALLTSLNGSVAFRAKLVEAMPSTIYDVVLELNFGATDAHSIKIGRFDTDRLGTGIFEANKLFDSGKYVVGLTLADATNFKDEAGNPIHTTVLATDPLRNTIEVVGLAAAHKEEPPKEIPKEVESLKPEEFALHVDLLPFEEHRVRELKPDYRFGEGFGGFNVRSGALEIGIRLGAAMPNTRYKVFLELNFGSENQSSHKIAFFETNQLGNGQAKVLLQPTPGVYNIGLSVYDASNFIDPKSKEPVPRKVLMSNPVVSRIEVPAIELGHKETPTTKHPEWKVDVKHLIQEGIVKIEMTRSDSTKSDSIEIKFDAEEGLMKLQYRETTNASQGSFQIKVFVKEVFEFLDKNRNGYFDPESDELVSHYTVDQLEWQHAQVEVIKVGDKEGKKITSFASINGGESRLQLNFYVFGDFAQAGGTSVKPTEMKIDLIIMNYPYSGGDTSVAIVAETEMASNYSSNVGRQNGDEGVFAKFGDLTGYFTWKLTALVDGTERRVNVTTGPVSEEFGQREQKLYFNYGRGSSIVHDPKLGVALAPSSIPIEVVYTPSGQQYLLALAVVGIVGAALVLEGRRKVQALRLRTLRDCNAAQWIRALFS